MVKVDAVINCVFAPRVIPSSSYNLPLSDLILGCFRQVDEVSSDTGFPRAMCLDEILPRPNPKASTTTSWRRLQLHLSWAFPSQSKVLGWHQHSSVFRVRCYFHLLQNGGFCVSGVPHKNDLLGLVDDHRPGQHMVHMTNISVVNWTNCVLKWYV